MLGPESKSVTFECGHHDYVMLAKIAKDRGVSIATVLRWAVSEYTSDHITARNRSDSEHAALDDAAAAKLLAELSRRDKKP